MRVFHDLEAVRGIQRAVVTTGSFDGVHIGHKSILSRLNKLARELGGESVLITFHPHPRKVLYPETAGKQLFLINSQKEKIELLGKTGLQNLLILPFTLEFSRMSSFDFIRKILVGKLHAASIVLGFNHHFGYKQEGDYSHLYELGKYHGFSVEEIPEQDIENETVSSTRIRKALLEGKIQRANAYLDHYYLIMGHLDKISGSPDQDATPSFSVYIDEDCKLIPPEGIYAVTINTAQGSGKGMALIRERDTALVPGKHARAVVLLSLDELGLHEQQEVCLYFHKLIREFSLPDRVSPEDRRVIEELIF